MYFLIFFHNCLQYKQNQQSLFRRYLIGTQIILSKTKLILSYAEAYKI